MSHKFFYEQFLADAPCYWRIRNDGARWRCGDCGNLFDSDTVKGTLTPNGSFKIICRFCIDLDWLQKAKYMGAM